MIQERNYALRYPKAEGERTVYGLRYDKVPHSGISLQRGRGTRGIVPARQCG